MIDFQAVHGGESSSVEQINEPHRLVALVELASSFTTTSVCHLAEGAVDCIRGWSTL